MDYGEKIEIKFTKSRTLWIPDVLFPFDFGHGCIGAVPVFKTKKHWLKFVEMLELKKLLLKAGW